MIMHPDSNPERRFVPAVLPWILAAVALSIYLLTLNHWVTLSSLSNVARATGWVRDPALANPLYLTVTYPLRWLPAQLIPLALNAFSALCAALCVGLLARCVTLLPQDRTEEQRVRCHTAFSLYTGRAAWLPPVFAALLLGLQLTFWEDATAASTEIFDLLLFAYVVRCLLEFRVQERDSWLLRAAVVYGAAITNNWAMIAYFPLFIASLIWFKGAAFFNPRFLLRMFAAGCVGLLCYLILPLAHVFAGDAGVGFWQTLKYNLVMQKTFLLSVVFNKPLLFFGDPPLWVLILPSLVPIFILAIRWPSFFGDSSRLGMLMTRWILHFFHAFLLLFCVWIALDPRLSPRNYHPALLASGIHLLPFYFLGALSVGYFSGYLLVVFGETVPRRQAFIFKNYPPFIKYPAVALVWLAAIFSLFGLTYRNLPQIRLTNGSLYQDFNQLSIRGLPATNSVLFSDDPRRTFLIFSATQREQKPMSAILVDTAALKDVRYHQELARKYPNVWPKPEGLSPKHPIDDLWLISIAMSLAETNALFYLHPSFGYYFEAFYSEPQGMNQRMHRYPTNSVLPPPISSALIAQNERFWAEAKPFLDRVGNGVSPTNSPRWADPLFEKLRLPFEPNRDALQLGAFISRSLNDWGVQLQREGNFSNAAPHFQRAIDLNPRNLVAAVNLEENEIQRSGSNSKVVISRALEESFGEHQNLSQVMNANGPFDSPSFCFRQGQEFARGNNFLQALQQFERVTELAPDNLAARLAMSRIYSRINRPDEALDIIQTVRAEPLRFGVGRSNVLEVTITEATAYLARRDPRGADTAFRKLAAQISDADIPSAAGQLFLNAGLFTNAIQWFDIQLAATPSDQNAMALKGYALLQSGQLAPAEALFEQLAESRPEPQLYGDIAQWLVNSGFPSNAVPWLDRQLAKDPGNANALVNKAYAWIQARVFSNAIPVLDLALDKLDAKDDAAIYFTALLNRAIAYLQSGNLEFARRDYQAIADRYPEAYQVQYGLAEIATRSHQTNTAVQHLQLYLSNAPPNTAEAKEVIARLKAWTPDKK